MEELDLVEIDQVSGGLTRIQNVGLGLGIATFALTVGAVVFAPVTVVSGGLWVLAVGTEHYLLLRLQFPEDHHC
jgi:type IV secretory pathway VirB3-like protein